MTYKLSAFEEKRMGKEGRIFNVIDSVKGGCGKTTFSLMLAATLDRMYGSDGKCNTCILDMDLLGTSMISLFNEDSNLDALNGPSTMSEHKNAYLNEIVQSHNTSDKKWIQSVSVVDKERKKRQFYIGFSDPSEEAKEEFRCDVKCNYIPATKFGVFRHGMKKILSKRELNGQVPDIEYIIMDFPPNSDIYAETAKNCLFDKKNNVLETGDICNYFLMVGMDLSHLNTTINHLCYFLKGEDRFPDNIFIVFNNLFKNPIDTEVEMYDLRRRKIEEAVEKKIKKENIPSKIYFCIMNRSEAYIEGTLNKESLNETAKDFKIDELFPAPIWNYVAYGQSFENALSMSHLDFYKVISGEEE